MFCPIGRPDSVFVSRYPWDDRLSEEHVRWCHRWPTRPSQSYIQHVFDTEGIHSSRGKLEQVRVLVS